MDMANCLMFARTHRSTAATVTRFRSQLGMSEEAEDSEPLVERHNHEHLASVASLNEDLSPTVPRRGPTREQAGARSATGRSPDVQVRAVVARARRVRADRRASPALHASRGKLVSLAPTCQCATGWGGLHRRSPTGGAAYRMPLKTRTSPVDEVTLEL